MARVTSINPKTFKGIFLHDIQKFEKDETKALRCKSCSGIASLAVTSHPVIRPSAMAPYYTGETAEIVTVFCQVPACNSPAPEDGTVIEESSWRLLPNAQRPDT